MLSFRLKESSWVDPFLKNIELITFAESLGGVESFVTYPTTQTHGDIPEEIRKERGVCDRLLRLSVGCEEAEDLIADLKQVFQRLRVIETVIDRKSTRLNSSHVAISYAVFCLKKKRN